MKSLRLNISRNLARAFPWPTFRGHYNCLRQSCSGIGHTNPMMYSRMCSKQRYQSLQRVYSGDLYGEEWYTPEDQYLVVGLAHCFEKNEDGKLVDRLVIEPISANSLEAMSHGAKTSFIHVYGLVLEDAIQREKALPSEFDAGVFCEGYEIRCDAAARTWMRPHAVDNLMYVSVRIVLFAWCMTGTTCVAGILCHWE